MKPQGECLNKARRAHLQVHVTKKIDPDVQHMIATHYLGRWPGVVTLVLKLRDCSLGKFVGVIVFALPPRETAKRYGGVTWELARLWVDDCMPKNTETYFMARGVDYIKTFHKDIEILVSYADPSVGHAGTIYKAANWKSDGRTDQERKTPRFDYMDPDTGKMFSRKSHVPAGMIIERVPRVSKHRFVYRLS
jgi:hypothetical protein